MTLQAKIATPDKQRSLNAPNQICIRYQSFCFLKMIILTCDFSSKVTCAFLAYSEAMEKISELTTFESENRRNLPHC